MVKLLMLYLQMRLMLLKLVNNLSKEYIFAFFNIGVILILLIKKVILWERYLLLQRQSAI